MKKYMTWETRKSGRSMAATTSSADRQFQYIYKSDIGESKRKECPNEMKNNRNRARATVSPQETDGTHVPRGFILHIDQLRVQQQHEYRRQSRERATKNLLSHGKQSPFDKIGTATTSDILESEETADPSLKVLVHSTFNTTSRGRTSHVGDHEE
jgi:hypothetical protein